MKQKLMATGWCVAGLTMALLVSVSNPSYAGYQKKFDNGVAVSLGADMRIRLTHFDRSAISPEMAVYGGPIEQGPAFEYLRVRTRVRGSLTLADGVKINAQVVNRTHNFSSRPGPNDNGPGTWQWTDEATLDQLNLQLTNIGGSNWSCTLGRQNLPLGLGMVFLEGTPYDQGRTIYFDGISLVHKSEKNTLKLFAFYNNYRDKAALINDEERRLSRGNIFTSGAYLTHGFAKSLSADVYYIYADVEDTRESLALGEFDASERNFPWGGPPPNADHDAIIHTAGLRLFGPISDVVSYSVELARQFGEYNEMADFTGCMLDARLTFKAPGETPLQPSLMLEYTRWSGDDPSSADEIEGWDPIFASYPIFREELLPIMFNGNWTNMGQYRAEVKASLNKCVKARAAYAYLEAEYGESPNAAGGGFGDSIGHLLSAFLDYKVNKYVTFSLEAAQFYPNSYWMCGDESAWLRFQTMLTY